MRIEGVHGVSLSRKETPTTGQRAQMPPLRARIRHAAGNDGDTSTHRFGVEEGTMGTPTRPEANTDIVRLNVNLNSATADTLKRLSDEQGVSLTEVVRRAISVYNFIDQERRSGNRIQTTDPDKGDVRELILM